MRGQESSSHKLLGLREFCRLHHTVLEQVGARLSLLLPCTLGVMGHLCVLQLTRSTALDGRTGPDPRPAPEYFVLNVSRPFHRRRSRPPARRVPHLPRQARRPCPDLRPFVLHLMPRQLVRFVMMSLSQPTGRCCSSDLARSRQNLPFPPRPPLTFPPAVPVATRRPSATPILSSCALSFLPRRRRENPTCPMCRCGLDDEADRWELTQTPASGDILSYLSGCEED